MQNIVMQGWRKSQVLYMHGRENLKTADFALITQGPTEQVA